MRTVRHEIEGPADFELGRARTTPLAYTAAFPDGPAAGLVLLIPGFGGDTDSDYAEALRRHVVQKHGMAAVSVRYHCFGARPETGATIEFDGRDHLMLLGIAYAKGVELDDPNDIAELARRLDAAGVETQVRATLRPAHAEDQNFGVLQAMDHLAVVADLQARGETFDTRRIIALGSSHGGYIAQMIAKLAPRTLAMVVDNSSYTQPPMEYLGQAESADYIAPLVGGVMAFCRTASAWSTANRQAPNFYNRDRDLIRDVAYPGYVAATRDQSGETLAAFRMINATVDGISPPHLKQRQAATYRAAGFDADLELVGEAQLDGRIFKQLVHGLDASLAGLLDRAMADLRSRPGPTDAQTGAVVTYECVDSIYSFSHSATAPYIHGAVTSRYFAD